MGRVNVHFFKHCPESDPYWGAVQDQMTNIQTIYAYYAEKQPILLFDIQEQRILVSPLREFS
jgi:hypothetical protein